MIEVLEPEYLVDNKGNKTKVLLDYNNYLELIELLEDLQDSKLIEEVMDEPEIPFDEFKRKMNLV